jgi:hypothetical protein
MLVDHLCLEWRHGETFLAKSSGKCQNCCRGNIKNAGTELEIPTTPVLQYHKTWQYKDVLCSLSVS